MNASHGTAKNEELRVRIRKEFRRQAWVAVLP